MPFRTINVENEIEKSCEKSQDFKTVWEENQEEYRLIGEMISLRKKRENNSKSTSTTYWQ
jgi:hypothetical protein